MSAPSFVSETEIAEKKKARQEEWDKVRRPEDPVEAPEEEYDHRSLFDRLEEQREKKQLEWEEAHRLKNMVKGLEDDEVEFLDLVDRTREKMDRQLRQEEDQVLKDYKEQVVQAEEVLEKEKQPVRKVQPNTSSKGISQKELLKGAVKRKGDHVSNGDVSKKAKPDSSGNNSDSTSSSNDLAYPSALTVAGVLPGIGEYTDSSDSDASSSSDPESYIHPQCDLLGRKIVKCNINNIISQAKS